MHPTVFLFPDTQIKDEAFVEDINNILNSGEVPNMFANEEKVQVCNLSGSSWCRFNSWCINLCFSSSLKLSWVREFNEVAQHI